MVDRGADRALHRQVADAIRERILAGEWAAGAWLPSEQHLADAYRVGRDTLRAAMVILRHDGLVVTLPGYGSRVRRVTPRVIRLGRRDEVVPVLRPTPSQCQEWGSPEGLPVALIYRLGGRVEVVPLDEVERFTTS